MSRFADTLNYSSVNEDWRTEARALSVGPGDRVLAITGGGRPLDLLALAPAEVVAIDAVPAQTALLELESAAMRTLDFDGYAAFLGLVDAPRDLRRATLARLAPGLSPEARRFWATHRRQVARGVLYEGRWERFFRWGSRVARLVRPGKVRRLFSFDDLAAQRAFVRDRWDTAPWRALHALFLSPPVLRCVLGDPGFHAHADVPAARLVQDRMVASLGRTLARDSFMVSLTLRGRLPSTDLPPRLTREGTAAIRPLLGRLRPVTGDLVAHLESVAPGAYTRFSLSDVPSYLDRDGFERLVAAMVRAAAPGARFCIRLFLSRPPIPERLAHRLAREPALERQLAEEDHAFAYDFIVGRVVA